MKLFAKYLILALAMAVLWILSMSIGTGVFGVDVATPQDASAGGILLFLFLASAINTAVIVGLILKTKWSGWKLAGGIALTIFGIQFFMSQIEALYFNQSLVMPVGLIYAVILGGLVLAVTFSMIAVTVFKKWKGETAKNGEDFNIDTGFVVKLIILAALVYPALYFTFGYFIAWQLPELRMLYSGSSEILPFFQHFRQTLQADPFFYPFQIFRGFLWLGLAMVLMNLVTANWKTKAFLTGITFALIMNAQLLVPNPSMSESIRLYHFIETASSNFIWGFAIVLLLHGRRKVSEGSNQTY